MKFTDLEQLLDTAADDKERIHIIAQNVHRLRGQDVRTALIALANSHSRQKDFKKAAQIYESLGMQDEAMKARSRIR